MNKNNWVLWALIVVCLLIAGYALMRSYRQGVNDGRNTAAASKSV
ncbi:MAG TPA: hypothetical protein VFW19_05080 [Allosphingosinicella sp.]|nr:hypothetical protein [Allosphingosinicella sp.]